MSTYEPDIEADILTALDRGESVGLMEPLRIGEGAPQRAALTDLAVDLAARAMNCYYSNLIEGHDTHPVDIERALKN